MWDDAQEVDCPYCGASISFSPDLSGGKKQTLVEDCSSCCKPIRFELEWDGEELIRFEAFQETE